MMKSISNNTRRIALVILLLILVVIMSTCQGGIKGTNNSPAARPDNSGSTANLAGALSDHTIQKTAHFLSNCAVCHADRDAAGKTGAVSPLITISAISPLDNIIVDANPQPFGPIQHPPQVMRMIVVFIFGEKII